MGRSGYFSASSIFAAGVFCLVAALFFGGKAIAAGHVLLLLSFVLAFTLRGKVEFAWRSLPRSAVFLCAFVIIAVISVVVNLSLIEEPFDHFKKLRYFLLTLLALAVPSLVSVLLQEKVRRDLLVLAWLLPMVFAVGCGLIGYATGSHPLRGQDVIHIGRVSGLYGQVMTFAYTLQFTVLTLFVFAFSSSWWEKVTRLPRWVVWVALGIAAIGLYFTFTRGAMIGALAGLATFAAFRSRALFIGICMIGIVAVGLAYFQGARYLKLESPIRQNQWKAAALSFVERPIFGLGFRNFERHSAELKERYGFQKDLVRKLGSKPERKYFMSHAHNNFLESFASMGILGGLVFTGFCYFWLREAWRSRYASLWVPLIVAFVLSGLFENTFFDSEVLNCILLIYFFSQVVMRLERQEKAHSEPEASSSSDSSS
ncbi:MAG: O-antigen ligase family protein [Verrucomicrobiota bacterium]